MRKLAQIVHAGLPTRARLWFAGLLVGLLPLSAGTETWVWVDEQGLTHFSNDASLLPAESERVPTAELSDLWAEGLTGPVLETPPGSSGGAEERVLRILGSAVDDLARGEEARAGAAFRSVLRLSPGRAEAHWYLAWIDRRRGRYESAAQHLRSFLASAGPDLDAWRLPASARLSQLEDEQQLADANGLNGPLQWVTAKSPYFEIQVDQDLDLSSREFTRRAMLDLERARSAVSEHMGVVPTEPLGVVFYGRAAYDREHAHRFNFRTVGFFDGRIHVAAQAHPSPQLGSLLFHEYSHAIFRERTGGDRPYWLNEGLAMEIERRASGAPTLSRSEKAVLRGQLESGEWIPLRDLTAGFSGLSNSQARDAYLQSVLVVDWILSRTTPDERARMLDLLGEGFSPDQVLHAATGLSVDQVEAAVWAELRSEFPAMGAFKP
ncbi:DUF4124 domain-containing protein [Myxococcota bacterium]|nr:DUF4124 domain-containing protein [Myxococcota bacterium]